MLYDIIIIGSGISGLYAAYNIKKHSPDTTFLILEKHKKQWIGGRANNETFYGTEIATGAGIGRKKDIALRKLLRELNPESDIQEFKSIASYSKYVHPIDIKRALVHLREEYKKQKSPSITFEQFAKPILGETEYNRFLITSGYTDYEKAGTHETLYDYGMEDNAGVLSAFSVHWNKMVLKIASKIGESHFKFSTEAHSIYKADSGFLVEVEHGRKYMCKKVIVATTISGIRSLFPKMPIYKEIEGQPFLRVYGKLAKASIPIMKEYVKGLVCVTGPLQQLISIDPENGVYMIAYNDNKNALKLGRPPDSQKEAVDDSTDPEGRSMSFVGRMKNRTQNTLENRVFYCNLIERSLGIPPGRIYLIGIRSYYWQIGTHYYKPLDYAKYKDRDAFIDEAQHPVDGILVVGEVVSKHQGWVEGTLESVDKAVTKRWVTDIRNRT